MLSIHKRAILALADNIAIEAQERINPLDKQDQTLLTNIKRNTQSIRALLLK
jgi:hypothetical protein